MWNMCVSIKFVSVISLAVICFACPIAISEVDQQQICDDCTEFFAYSIRYMGPVGQEFTPTLPRMDAVELFVEDFDQSDGLGAELQLKIRRSTIDGTIIGTSASVFVPDLFRGIVHFDFAETVPLLQGSLYVIEINQLSGGNFGICGCSIYEGDPYPYGRVITKYGPISSSDLWFREGMNPLDSDNLSGWVYMPQDAPDIGYSLNEADLVYFYSFYLVQSFNITITIGGWSTHMPTDWVYFDWPFYYELDPPPGSLWFALPPESGLWVFHFSTGQWEVLPRIIPW